MNATIPARTGARITVPVALEGRGYDIHIGRHQLCEAAALIATFAPGARAALVTDESVAALHAAAFRRAIQASSGRRGKRAARTISEAQTAKAAR